MSKRTRFRASLFDVLQDDLARPVSRTRRSLRRVSEKTIADRKAFIHRFVDIVYAAGYQPEKAHNIDRRHVEALLAHWERKQIQANTAATYISPLRLMLTRLDKLPLLVRVMEWLDARKVQEAVENAGTVKGARGGGVGKAWSSQGVDYRAVIERIIEVDSLVALQLCLMRAFGLRVREAHRLRPEHDWKGQQLYVRRGTKGGRPRDLPVAAIPVEEQPAEELLQHACEVARRQGGSMMPETYTEKQWRNHYYWVLRKCGVTRTALGITSHGLRHERAQEQYRALTGEEPPVCQGGGEIKDGSVGLAIVRGRRVIAEYLGHGRYDITRHYLDEMAQKGKARSVGMRMQRGLRKVAA